MKECAICKYKGPDNRFERDTCLLCNTTDHDHTASFVANIILDRLEKRLDIIATKLSNIEYKLEEERES